MYYKKRKVEIFAIIVAVLMFCPLLGCSGRTETGESESSMASQETDLSEEYYIDPSVMDKVLEEIYSNVPDLLKDSVETPSEDEIEEVLKLSPSNIDDYYIRYSSGSFGLADLYVIKPASDAIYEVKGELEDLRLRRIEEFEEYDVYDALTIAQNAEVTEIGNYVVLIMIADSDQVLELLKPIIPTGY